MRDRRGGGFYARERIVTAARPMSSIALSDGFAVEARRSPMRAVSSALLPRCRNGSTPANPCRVEPSRGAVDAMTQRGERVEAVVPVMTGQAFCRPAATPRRRPYYGAGRTLRDIDCAVAAAVGFAELNVREPRIWIARGRAATEPLIVAGLAMLSRLVGKYGAPSTAN